MKKNVLYLLEMGMDDNSISYDIKNYRIRTLENIDIIYQGEKYNLFFEFLQATHYRYRNTHKVTGRPLKKAIRELVEQDGLSLDTQYERMEKLSDGREWEMSYRLGKFEQEIWNEHHKYTRKDILEVVNRYKVGDPFTEICLVEEAARNIIKSSGGWRELDILGENKDFRTEGDSYFHITDTWNDNYKVVKCIKREWESCGNNARRLVEVDSCEIEIISGRITG